MKNFFLIFFTFIFYLQANDKLNEIIITSTNDNYYLASITGENSFYAPTFFDDYLLKSQNKNILQFSKINNEIVDFYFHITKKDLDEWAFELLKKNKSSLDEYSKKIYTAILKYKESKPNFTLINIHKQLADLIKLETGTTLSRVVAEAQYKGKINKILFQYLISNGINDISEIISNKNTLNLIINKFFVLSTTYFFRDWYFIKPFINYLPFINKNDKQKNKSLKIKIYACSTGEEVFSFAIELLENGYKNFTILASDINDSSIAAAKQMVFPYNSFNRLPLKTQKILKKYFKLNKTINSWEIKNPNFFKKRIKFINQNILDDLPNNLEKEFSPPYDIISMLNVLIYIDEKLILKKKNYWLKLLKTNGILILHDAKFNLSKGWLGNKWNWNNFYNVNEWINIKNSSNFNINKKIKKYTKEYKNNINESLLLSLFQAYTFTDQSSKALEITETYLDKYPYSVIALRMVIPYYSDKKNKRKYKFFFDKMMHAHINHFSFYSYLIQNEKNSKELKYLKKFFNIYKEFMSQYSENPEYYLNTFNFIKPKTKKYKYLLPIIKIYCHSLIQEMYFINNDFDNFIISSKKGFELIKNYKDQYKNFIIISKWLNSIIKKWIEHLLESNKLEEAFTICNESLEILKNSFKDEKYFFYHEAFGIISYYKSALLIKLQGKDDEILNYINKSISHLEHALVYIETLSTFKRSNFFGVLGKSYMIRGKYYLSKNERSLAQSDFFKAFTYFELGLEMNPIYGKDLYIMRKELLTINKKENILNIE